MKYYSKKFFVVFSIVISLLVVSSVFTPGVFAAEKTSQEKTATILNDVIGLNLQKYEAIPKSVSSDVYLDAVTQENVRYALQSNGSRLDVLHTYTEGNLRMIVVLDVEGSPIVTESFTSIVSMAKGFLKNYQNYSKNQFFGNLESMLGVIDFNKKTSSTTSGNVKLDVNTSNDLTTFRWTYTINGVEAKPKCVVLGYENGFLKYFIDNWDLYEIGNTEINLSEEDAIINAIKAVENFSWQVGSEDNTFEVTDFNVTQGMILSTGFCSSTDSDNSRGKDPFVLYPMHYVWVSLDKYYPGNVYGMEVALWADTKEISYIKERFSTVDPPAELIADINTNTEIIDSKTDMLSIELIVFPSIISILLTSVSILWIKTKGSPLSIKLPKLRFSRFFSKLFFIFLISLLVFVPNSMVFADNYAGRSTIWGSESAGDTSYEGSTGRKTITEIIDQRSVATFLNTVFSLNGYDSSNYQGNDSIKATMLSNISYNEQNYPLVAVVDFDHGVGRNDSYADYGELHYLIEDNIGNMNFSIPADGTDPDNWVNTHLVYDMDIFNQTSLGKTFFAFINTCASGSIETSLLGYYPGLPYGGGNNTNGKPVGMPYAWTHRTVGNRSDSSFSLALNTSIDGYVDADGGDFCYLGYTWGSAALSQIVDPNYPTVPHGSWVSKFFQFALADDVTVNQALDLASYNKYSSSFGETVLCQNFTAEWPMYRYNETVQEWQWRTDRGYNCTLAVYGNGNITLYQPFLNITAADDGGSPLSVSVTIDGASVGSTNVSERVSNFPAEEHTIQVSVPNGYFFQNFTVGANTYVTNPATISVTSDTSVVAYFTDDPPQAISVEVFIDSVPDDGYSRYHALTVDNDIPTVFWTGDWYNQNQDAITAITGTTLHFETAFYLTEGNHTIEYAVSSASGYEWSTTITVNDVIEAQQETNRYNQISAIITVEPGDWYWISPSSSVDSGGKWV